MEYIVSCWNGCGEEFTVRAPDRQDPRLVDGIPARCPDCNESYNFTVDGDGEPSLDSPTGMGDNIDDVDADRNTNF